MIDRMKHMKDTLIDCVQGQLGDLSSVDARELGEAVDMIKDLAEAIYYCTITKSMENGEEKEKYYPVMYYNPTDLMDHKEAQIDRHIDELAEMAKHATADERQHMHQKLTMLIQKVV